MDSTNPYIPSSGFMDLLTSQPLHNYTNDDELDFTTDEPSVDAPKAKERRERRKWSQIEDLVLISAWLNTSKDAVIGNEQKSNAFWSCIASYYEASPKLGGVEKRKHDHYKQRWHKINDQVCKFVGSYTAATKQKSSGQNEDDVIKLAYQIFFNDYNIKFTLEHAWRELRHDQKWCFTSTKDSGGSKRRKLDDYSSQSSTSVPFCGEEDQPRPSGVKAAKAKAKRSVEAEKPTLKEYQAIWEIKQKDLAMKEKLSKHKVLDNLLAKTEPLSEMEMALKNKLITDMLSNT